MAIVTRNYELLDKYAYIENTSEGSNENMFKRQCKSFPGEEGHGYRQESPEKHIIGYPVIKYTNHNLQQA